MTETDYEAIKERFAEERDLRLGYRPEGTAQFITELAGDLARYEVDPYADEVVERDPIDDTVEILFIGGGFSAGAFLAVDVALDPRAEPLAFIAPIYGGETLGATVPTDAPSLFTAVAQDDILYKIVELLHVDWTSADRSSELHVFARGQHGFGMVRQGMPSDHWTELFLRWLEDLDR